MEDKRKDVLDYWNQSDVESMYDKHLLQAEIQIIRSRIAQGSKVLDAGCGEGEGTVAYASITGAHIHAADFSDTRLAKAEERLKGQANVVFSKIDFLGPHALEQDYDVVVSQRFLINLLDWNLQSQVLLDLVRALRPEGRLLMLEGSLQGVDELNKFRALLKLPPIPIKWHNVFFDDEELVAFMEKNGCRLDEVDGLGAYFMLTRGVRPVFDETLGWACEFNRTAASEEMRSLLQLGQKFSRLKLWVFSRQSRRNDAGMT
jgi:SAM-dependent methyltransferase